MTNSDYEEAINNDIFSKRRANGYAQADVADSAISIEFDDGAMFDGTPVEDENAFIGKVANAVSELLDIDKIPKVKHDEYGRLYLEFKRT